LPKGKKDSNRKYLQRKYKKKNLIVLIKNNASLTKVECKFKFKDTIVDLKNLVIQNNR
jgi:hypothetical protein